MANFFTEEASEKIHSLRKMESSVPYFRLLSLIAQYPHDRSLPPHPSELVSQLQKDFQLTGDEARSLVFRLDGALEYFFQTLKSLSGTTSEVCCTN